jgi:HSP20 family protein
MANDIDMTRSERPAGLWDWFEGPDLGRWLEGWWPAFRGEDKLRIEQEVTDDSMLIRAEMPGIDPAKDVEITLEDGMLMIRGERRSENVEERAGRTRSEFRYGSFSRVLRVPKDMDPDDVSATYKDGILEVTFPYKVPTVAQPRTVTVSTS